LAVCAKGASGPTTRTEGWKHATPVLPDNCNRQTQHGQNGIAIASGGTSGKIFEQLRCRIVYFVSMIKNTRKSKASAGKVETGKPGLLKDAFVAAPTPKPLPVAAKTRPIDRETAQNTTVSAPVQGLAGKPDTGCVWLELVNPVAKQVCVAGSFNEWKPERAPLIAAGNGRWIGNLRVKPGRYEYLFVVDGQWLPDPNAKESVQNPFGGRNSVLTVSA
jgi:hypothetical protein